MSKREEDKNLYFRTTNCFKGVQIKELDEKGNPDIQLKLRENKQKINKFIQSNFSVWDGYKMKEPYVNAGRRPSPLLRFIQGMKGSLFGERGKITKKIKFMKNMYKDETNKKQVKLKELNNRAIITNTQSNFAPELGNFSLRDLMKDIPESERKDFLKKNGIKIRAGQNTNKNKKICDKTANSKEEKLLDFSFEEADRNYTTQNISSKSKNMLRRPSLLPDVKTKQNLALYDNPKTRNSFFNVRRVSTVGNSPIVPTQENKTTDNRKPLMTAPYDYTTSYNELKIQINKKYKIISKKSNRIQLEVSKKNKKLKHPLENKKKKYHIMDKEVIRELNSKYMRENKDSIGIIGTDPDSLKIKGYVNATAEAKADLIKLADKVSKLNDVMAVYLADKIIKDYNKTAIIAAVDEKTEFQKNYNLEFCKKPLRTNITKNIHKIKKINYNLVQTHNSILNMLNKNCYKTIV